MAVLQNTLIITSPQRDEITKVYKIFRGRVCHGRGEKRERHSEILMSYRQVGIAADYELNSLSTRVLSLSLSFPPSSVSFTLLHNSHDPWRAAASPGIFVGHSFELLFPPTACFSFVQPHCQGILFPSSTRRKVLAVSRNE